MWGRGLATVDGRPGQRDGKTQTPSPAFRKDHATALVGSCAPWESRPDCCSDCLATPDLAPFVRHTRPPAAPHWLPATPRASLLSQQRRCDPGLGRQGRTPSCELSRRRRPWRPDVDGVPAYPSSPGCPLESQAMLWHCRIRPSSVAMPQLCSSRWRPPLIAHPIVLQPQRTDSRARLTSIRCVAAIS